MKEEAKETLDYFAYSEDGEFSESPSHVLKEKRMVREKGAI
jgi:hypothetical protein